MSNDLTCFKAYDIRGRIPDQLNEDIAYRIGAAFARQMSPEQVVVGHDIRLSSPQIASAVSNGLLDSGVDVIDIGLCGTEEVYFATSHLETGGGIMVTASHNPADYNGMKLVREGSRPVSGDTGLNDIRRTAETLEPQPAASRGRLSHSSVVDDYVAHLLGYVEAARLKPLKIVTNAGNGGAGHVIDRLERELPFEFIKVHHEPDGSFPHGVPNPLLPENRAATSEAVRSSGADFGLAWDGDFDRCFFFDANGDFIEGYYIVGLLARSVLSQSPGEKIIHDPRLTWNTRAIVEKFGGVPIQSKTGHAFIKERMRNEDAAYGGEMSAHHYFRDFFYCDSGMIPWLLVASILSDTGETLSSLVSERMEAYPVSGEINRELADPAAAIRQVFEQYGPDAVARDETDGLSLEFTDWRFNLRMSNTEPVVRLNVETRGDRELMERRTKELLDLLD